MTRRVASGWYPDYDAPPGHQRYWDGARWSERRRSAAPETDEPTRSHRPVAGWAVAVVAGLVVTSAVVLVVGEDQPAASGPGTAPPAVVDTGGAASASPAPETTAETTAETTPETAPEPQEGPAHTWQVSAAVDGTTLLLSNGVEVRLSGVQDGCATLRLAKLVVGQRVTLVRRGLDKDATGRLLRYVELRGVDVGLRLIQRGWAHASDVAHARGQIYRRVDARTSDACT